MKKPAPLFLILVALVLLVLPSRAADETDQKLTKQVSDILTECQKLTPGITRQDLLKIFTTEGGISTPTQHTYVHRRCPVIKIDVDFTPVDPKQKKENPADKVLKISKPYLDWSIMD